MSAFWRTKTLCARGISLPVALIRPLGIAHNDVGHVPRRNRRAVRNWLTRKADVLSRECCPVTVFAGSLRNRQAARGTRGNYKELVFNTVSASGLHVIVAQAKRQKFDDGVSVLLACQRNSLFGTSFELIFSTISTARRKCGCFLEKLWTKLHCLISYKRPQIATLQRASCALILATSSNLCAIRSCASRVLSVRQRASSGLQIPRRSSVRAPSMRNNVQASTDSGSSVRFCIG